MCFRRFALAIGLISGLASCVSADDPPSGGRSPDNKAPTAEEIKRLIQQLGDNDFATLAAAKKQLEAIGKPALDALKNAAKNANDPEIRIAAKALIEKIEGPALSADLTKMQGTWYYVDLEMDGSVKGSVFGNQSIVIKGDKFTTTSGNIVYKGTLKLDPTQKPKTLDLVFTEAPPERKNPTKAIYEFDGVNLKLCFAINGDNRPKAFATKPKDGFVLHTLSRNEK